MKTIYSSLLALVAVPLMAGDPSVVASTESEALSDLKAQVKALSDKVNILERKEELAAEEKEKAKLETPIVVADDKGLMVQSADKKNVFRLRGLIQADSRWYIDDGGSGANDSFVLRRARPIFEGKLFENFEFRLMPDFGGSAISIQDAYINVNYWKAFQVQAGKFKEPVGLEVLQSDPFRMFIENGLPSNLVPNRDVGVMFHGELLDGRVLYQAGGFNGLGDGRTSTNLDFDDDRDFAARIFLQPWKTETGYLKGLGFGLGSSIGRRSGGATGLTAGYLTDGQQAFFTYNTPAAASNAVPIVTADGWVYRLAPQGYYYYGPFSLLAEWTLSSTEARLTGAATNIRGARFDNTAWQVATGWVLTGEDASYQGVKPSKPFTLEGEGYGAFELVARYGELNIDGDAFTSAPGSTGAVIGPAASSGSAQDAESFGIGLNWYLNNNIRVSVNYFESWFFGGATGTNPVVQAGEHAILTRLQLNF